MKSNLLKYLLYAIAPFTLSAASAQQLAFPGAEGFGKYATGGRGGKVVEVTNLNDSGPGSFRQAFEEYPGEPITIVFQVGGTIELQSPVNVKRSNITIAGQTAPGDGITLKGHSFIINGARAKSQGGNHGNIIVRYIRSRPGGTDPRGLYGFDMENCHDVIVDHCSFSWANEEVAAMYDTKNTTVQWSIISEGLYKAGHMKGVRGYGGVWGGQNASYHHNLMAHLNSRAIRFNGARAHDTIALVDYRHNVIYNWGNANAAYGGEVEIPGGASKLNLVNNYYKPGPATPKELKFVQASYNENKAKGIGQWYVSGNVMEGNPAMTKNNWLAVDLKKVPEAKRDEAKAAKAFEVSVALPEKSAAEAYKTVLQNAGATLPARDAVDKRIVEETRTGTATGKGSHGGTGIIDSPSAVGGWPAFKGGKAPVDTDKDGMPDEWEKKYGLNPSNPEDRNGDLNGDGYTNLEEYLNGTDPVKGKGAVKAKK
ncbi:pectate lyase family protein [Botryobacter ruber]|uniref:pectate lyase family protein n=1 Tax=Botryobacter ruber TaxID=2171629 RepID=UPI001F0BE3EB|nr:pectate lyase [Botryobacter ruber]